VPRIGTYLFHRDNAAKIEKQPAAIRAGTKEEIRRRLILLGGNSAIVQHGQFAGVWVALTVHKREPGLTGGIICWRGHGFERERGRVGAAFCGDAYFGIRNQRGHQHRSAGD
jgi:hypothetical protein